MQKTIESVLKLKEIFPNCEIILETFDPDPVKNLEIAKEFGKAGIRGTWRKKKNGAIHKENEN